MIDCSWRRVPKLLRTVDGSPERRRLPEHLTASPRRAKTFEAPPSGLAAIEALFIACAILDRPRPDPLGEYPWREEFLRMNSLL